MNTPSRAGRGWEELERARSAPSGLRSAPNCLRTPPHAAPVREKRLKSALPYVRVRESLDAEHPADSSRSDPAEDDDAAIEDVVRHLEMESPQLELEQSPLKVPPLKLSRRSSRLWDQRQGRRARARWARWCWAFAGVVAVAATTIGLLVHFSVGKRGVAHYY